jgi:hypothetical protein
MEEARCGAVFSGNKASIPMIQITFPPFSAKSVHPSVNLPSSNGSDMVDKAVWLAEHIGTFPMEVFLFTISKLETSCAVSAPLRMKKKNRGSFFIFLQRFSEYIVNFGIP